MVINHIRMVSWGVDGLISFLKALQFLGVLPKGHPEGLAIWVYVVTYGGLFLWGVTVFIATLSFQHRIKNKQPPKKGILSNDLLRVLILNILPVLVFRDIFNNRA